MYQSLPSACPGIKHLFIRCQIGQLGERLVQDIFLVQILELIVYNTE